MQDRQNSHQNRHSGMGIFILFVIALLFIAGAAGMFYGSLIQEKPKDLTDTTVESFDLLEESKIAHRLIDEVLLLKRENWQLRDTERREHKDILETTGADIVWTDREIAVGVPVTTDREGAARWVKDHLLGTDVKPISEEMSEWHGMEAYKLVLGISVKSGKSGERSFITDTVYFFYHGNLTNRDRDISERSKEESRREKENRETQ